MRRALLPRPRRVGQSKPGSGESIAASILCGIALAVVALIALIVLFTLL